MKLVFALLIFTALSAAQAARIAVIDSGLDYKHEMITPNLWTNSNEVFDRRDNDGNGYQDDVHGWNFAEQNGDIIDYKYLGTFSPDCKKFFDIQGKNFLGLATESEMAWVKEKFQDPKFIKEMGKFGNFVHGTHVAGITIKNSNSEAMGLKLIPTEIKPFFERNAARLNKSSNLGRWEMLASLFDMLAVQQMTMLGDIARFASFHKAHIANGSFGTGFPQAKMIGGMAFKALFFRKPTADEELKVAKLFMDALIKNGQSFVNAAPEILFVFAAGNDGLSNDLYGSSPANIRADNVITVGATYKNEFFAPFSNFGTSMVDIAAPGMLIPSSIPGNDYLEVSGTSQAAPYVANVAAKIKDANPNLAPLEIKKILLGTVDKKGFLTEKVTAGGIVNSDRAVVAAQMSKVMPMAYAIKSANTMIKDVPTSVTPSKPKMVEPLALTPMFE